MNQTDSQLRWLIIRNGAVGDTVLLSPLIQCIRNHQSHAWIEVMGNKERVELLTGSGLADQAASFDQPGIETLFSLDTNLPPHLEVYFSAFDRIVYFGQSGLESIQKKLQIRKEQSVLVHPAIPKSNDIHITKHYCSVLHEVLDTKEEYIPRIRLSEKELKWGEKWIQQHCAGYEESSGLTGVHVGAGSKEKQVPLEMFHNAIAIHRKSHLFIPKGPADEDAVSSFIKTVPADVSYTIVEQLPLRKLACVIAHCNVFVGNDSGITHIAAALGISATVFFTASNPSVWAPVGRHVKVVELNQYNSA